MVAEVVAKMKTLGKPMRATSKPGEEETRGSATGLDSIFAAEPVGAHTPLIGSVSYKKKGTKLIPIHHHLALQSPYVSFNRSSNNISKMGRMSSSVQSWVDEHKLATIGGVWAAAVGASVAYSRRRTPQRATSLRLIHARMHAQALTLAVLGGAAFAHHYYNNKNSKNTEADLDYDFYSQLPSATDADGNENERWSW